jgi:RNA polymerase sigma-70 factor (ECF subfamily)
MNKPMSAPREPNEKDPSINQVFIDNMVLLRRYLGGFFGSKQDIEDVLQDTYIRAVEAEAKAAIKAPKAFLYKISKNLALNHHNRAANKITDAVADFDSLDVLYQTIDLEDQVDQEQRFSAFCQSVKSLPPQCRKVFILKKIYGLSNSHIAQRLGIAVSTVDKHLAKGLLLCRNDLRRKGVEMYQPPSQRKGVRSE